uniref:Uncharacterized protein n=1 Tax=Oryza sativa subsp. japonica TaxID=39947 RepID=Q6Z2K6_ORYSJ|nr:hypothetical protein [Oryza sativa Japonica Group]BAD16134.1 hypothetical protein [Oryza sativa Japonica Group]
MWRRKHEVGIAHRQEIVSRGDEIDGDNEDVAEAASSLAIRPAMAERDRKTGPGVAEGDPRDWRGSAMDGAPDAHAWRGAADVEGRDDGVVDGEHKGCDCGACIGTDR